MDVFDTLQRLGIDPKKSLGQNFMIEQNALRRLAEAAELDGDDAVLEIGAGLGSLTGVLAEQARRLVAVEIDQRLIDHLRAEYADVPLVEVVHGDILTLAPSDLLGDDARDYVVVANLPYYITTAILRHLLESDTPPRRLVLTVQREVGERMAAAPDDMSLLAVSVQFYGMPVVVTRLSAGNFYPRPNVESAVVRIDPHPGGPPVPRAEADAFFRVVRAGFSQPRKQVKNSLAAGLHAHGASVLAWLEAAGIDPRRRPETMTVDEWVRLYEVIRDEERQYRVPRTE